jgi:hypothetical protein
MTRLGVKTRIFHLGDYRRATIPFGEDMPDDYFYVNGSNSITIYLILHADILFSDCQVCFTAAKDCEEMPRRHLSLFESREWSNSDL